jgi:hypothetical protein
VELLTELVTVSWVERTKADLTIDERFFIWLLRPPQNKDAVS